MADYSLYLGSELLSTAAGYATRMVPPGLSAIRFAGAPKISQRLAAHAIATHHQQSRPAHKHHIARRQLRPKRPTAARARVRRPVPKHLGPTAVPATTTAAAAAMGGRQIRPAGVFKAVAQELNHQVLPGHSVAQPPWFQVMNSVPPAETLVRNVTPRHRVPNPKSTRPKKLYRPQGIAYLEDALRTGFYKDHPWELARPRVVLELDGKDHQHCDWSKGLRQPGVPLSGECVVQRQLWLMQNEKMSKRRAYDAARHEFYRLRQAEEIEKRVAIEEARHVGAYFGKSRLDVGMQLEDQEFENWKIWAGKETANREARQNSEIETFGLEDDAETAVDAAAPAEGQPVPATTA
ncbi:hypothetical protein PCL_08787 [Purpureocillium lilacinum]|uniref:Small ribosomal subunit protein mS23 n=1 Tax=Purpureocillium lilacinum TaxID=33203 RepID=A0A2U3EG78_PURLI|nr:hypothetical protein PCL_08787 [Purpureocillium lilacinum]